MRYAARLNAFKIGAETYWPGRNRIGTVDVLERAATAGLNAADLNYPDHFEDTSPSELQTAMDGMGVALRSLCRVLDYVGIDYHLRDFDDIRAARGF